jgi:hypothetical protein
LKNKLALGAASLAVAFTLTGCTYVESAVINGKDLVNGSTVGPNMIKGELVKTSDGSYRNVKMTQEFGDATNAGWESEQPTLHEDGFTVDGNRIPYRNQIGNYFFTHFIDSTALEGGQETRTAWTNAALKDSILSNTKFTKDWAEKSDSYQVLTLENISKNPGLKSLIHDGEPRMTDANLKFGDDDKFIWAESEDGSYLTVPITWSVDYRVTDETVFDMLRAQNKTSSDEEIRSEMTDEAQDGKGENVLRVTGETDFLLLDNPENERTPIYATGTELTYTLESSIKPEFHHKKDARK